MSDIGALIETVQADISALASAYQPPAKPPRFGIATGGAVLTEDAATLGRDLDAIRDVGCEIVRVDANWRQIQAGGWGKYDWSKLDSLVAMITSRGMQPHLTILFSPAWLHPTGGNIPPDPVSYSAFCTQVAGRYGPEGVRSFEIWNEPNNRQFWSTPDAGAYAKVLSAALTAIKAVDPTLTVVTGGTAPEPNSATSISPVDFLAGVYAAGGRFDAVGHHPYCSPAMPGSSDAWSAWHQMIGAARSLRSVMVANGDGAKQIWATEYGAPTGGPADLSIVSQETQAAMITAAYDLWSTYPWAGPLFVYQHRDLGAAATTREDFYGLLRYDFTPKPSYGAYQAMAGASR